MNFSVEHLGLPARDPVMTKDWYVLTLDGRVAFDNGKTPPVFFVQFHDARIAGEQGKKFRPLGRCLRIVFPLALLFADYAPLAREARMSRPDDTAASRSCAP